MSKSFSTKGRAKEFTEIQKLKHENQKLKRQLERLRKQLARVDFEEYSNIKEALEAQQREDVVFEQQNAEREITAKWRCFQCSEDYLRLVIVQRPDGDFYFRKCPKCENRTRLKPFSENVQGPRAG
jgi:hypothetical protein